jgi:hypothetical protein
MSDLSNLSAEMYKAWEKSMGAWWDQVLDTPEFLKAMGDGATASATARRQWEEGVDQTLTQWHLPTRGDLTRVARIASLVEDRLLQVEDQLLSLEDRLVAIEREALKARIESTEHLVALTERLAALEARLTPASDA